MVWVLLKGESGFHWNRGRWAVQCGVMSDTIECGWCGFCGNGWQGFCRNGGAITGDYDSQRCGSHFLVEFSLTLWWRESSLIGVILNFSR